MIFFDLGKYKNFNYKNIYSKANGTFSYLIYNNYELHLSLIKLPSNIKKYLTLNYLCTLGRNSNIFNKFIIISKAGYNKNLGKRFVVRGNAMNSVDHPHGGRTKSNKPEVSPWGE